MEKKQFITNIFYAFSAQGVSLTLSIIMSLVIPKVLGVEQFSFWQLFVFYGSYVGLFHFGIADGAYLKLGGCKLEEVDNRVTSTLFMVLVCIQFFVSIAIALFIYMGHVQSDRNFVLYMTIINLISANIFYYLGYLQQALNKTKNYSISMMISKGMFLLSLIVILLFKIDSFKIIIVIFLISQVVSMMYLISLSKELIFSRPYTGAKTLNICKEYMTGGIKLMLANLSSVLILGVGRIMIDNTWGIVTFGKISLSLSLTTFFLQFISQISLVLFPALRSIGPKKQRAFFINLYQVITVLLPLILVLYIPAKILLTLWLPDYKESLNYLSILIPICVFDGKMNLLYSTYLKIIRKEGKLFFNNILSVVVSVFFVGSAVYIFRNLTFVCIGMTVAIGFRSIISGKILAKFYSIKILKTTLTEICYIVLFILLSLCVSNDLVLLVLSLIMYVIWLVINKSYLKSFSKLTKMEEAL